MVINYEIHVFIINNNIKYILYIARAINKKKQKKIEIVSHTLLLFNGHCKKKKTKKVILLQKIYSKMAN